MGAKWFWGLTVLITCVTNAVLANVQSKVRCSKDFMEVDIVRTKSDARIYLEQLKNYPDEACKPVINNGVATFKLSLEDVNMLRCGMARIVDEMTGRKIYYHRIIVEDPSSLGKQTFMVKCIVMEMNMFNKTNHKIVRKSVLPAGFQEDDSIDVRGVIKGCAPIPMLSVGVRQGGNLVTGELNVSPGTPLQMEIFLDSEAAPVYGLLATYMQVTDTKSAEETIIFNGCSVDPYLFENFDTVDGDFLTAKFRAFKFPESTYVQFRGTVNVCLDKCSGIECSNGQIGFGRRKRSISKFNDKNRVFQVTMSTFIKVDYDRDIVLDEELSQFIRRGKNRTMEQRPVIGEEVREQFLYKLSEAETNGTRNIIISNILIILILTICHFSGNI